jgi:hypothetical protein
MPVKDWTPEQVEQAMKYGVCRECGAPRTIYDIEDGVIGEPESVTRTIKLVCSAEPMKHPQ